MTANQAKPDARSVWAASLHWLALLGLSTELGRSWAAWPWSSVRSTSGTACVRAGGGLALSIPAE
ncbi:hypothetical protein [Azotobacter beijerinckii]|uniref:hypothetical protein n=1 Tax=Azotobacter beijerinckii TaxID=170623 RepID=UPI0011608DC7|nr:hypothetical protein [Azotobacter beijerinckii]